MNDPLNPSNRRRNLVSSSFDSYDSLAWFATPNVDASPPIATLPRTSVANLRPDIPTTIDPRLLQAGNPHGSIIQWPGSSSNTNPIHDGFDVGQASAFGVERPGNMAAGGARTLRTSNAQATPVSYSPYPVQVTPPTPDTSQTLPTYQNVIASPTSYIAYPGYGLGPNTQVNPPVNEFSSLSLEHNSLEDDYFNERTTQLLRSVSFGGYPGDDLPPLNDNAQTSDHHHHPSMAVEDHPASFPQSSSQAASKSPTIPRYTSPISSTSKTKPSTSRANSKARIAQKLAERKQKMLLRSTERLSKGKDPRVRLDTSTATAEKERRDRRTEIENASRQKLRDVELLHELFAFGAQSKDPALGPELLLDNKTAALSYNLHILRSFCLIYPDFLQIVARIDSASISGSYEEKAAAFDEIKAICNRHREHMRLHHHDEVDLNNIDNFLARLRA
ncbi:hypothetical protein SISSUDRAFT_1064437 [Sistotremastrum suecicum HHB10207 ss-3]|uniref:Uncharacterized protein n=1 Tax=Sistotremastrum suecicum HHB10207 ss-3 TaxID=1314776 RepID=A0A166ANM6_9AGAM|nr:hypothetical protein SISSUDRAFT_1064437 [Sistotremastrum suecicum HHB10207 ss-3]